MSNKISPKKRCAPIDVILEVLAIVLSLIVVTGHGVTVAASIISWAILSIMFISCLAASLIVIVRVKELNRKKRGK